MLCEENPTCMFATLIAGILNRRTGMFRYVNAGHDVVVFGEQGVNYRSLPPPRGILIGLDPGATYEVASLVLDQGDVLLLYTDGVTEAMNHDRDLFTMDRLMECLRQKPASSPQDLAERIKLAVREFAAGAPPSDDVTLVILRYRGA
jgi:sigma-B regulation protein RsbU (phosphoserine phosphatase)